MAQTQVDVGADALHRLYGQRAAQVLGVGPRRGQAKAKPAAEEYTDSRFKMTGKWIAQATEDDLGEIES